MKKLVSIFLILLYAASSSASYGSIQSCLSMGVIQIDGIGAMADCCCGHMDNQDSDQACTGDEKTAQSEKTIDFDGNFLKIKEAGCCSSLAVTSRLTVSQLNNDQRVTMPDRGVGMNMATLPNFITIAPVVDRIPPLYNKLRYKTPPPRLALYKLFQRFTFYG